jgi:cephalosporin-C deacetylase-like acetyl esterase
MLKIIFLKKYNFISLVILLFALPLHAQYEMNLEFPAESNGLFNAGKAIEIIFFCKNNSISKLSGRLNCQFANLNGQSLSNETKDVTVYAKDLQAVVFSYLPNKAGFYKVKVELEIEGAKPQTFTLTAGYATDKIQVGKTGKSDFEAFWQMTIQELAQTSPQFKLTPRPTLSTARYEMYSVEMKSLDNVTIRGIYRHPKGKKNVPVVLQIPSLGGGFVNTQSLEEQPLYGIPLDFAVLSLNIRGHGNSRDQVNMGKNMFAYITHNLHDKRKYVYRGAVADVIRGLDFISQRAEIDKDRIVIEGASQGGGLSLIVAALDSRVKLCAADVPFLCDMEGLTTQTDWVRNEIDKYIKKNKWLSFSQALHNLSYFDTKNFAHLIKVPVLMSTGLQDKTCPPATNFATFNKIKSSFKQYCVYPYGKHGGGGREHRKLKFEWIRNWFGMQ